MAKIKQGQRKMYKVLHRQLKIEHIKLHYKPRANSGTLEVSEQLEDTKGVIIIRTSKKDKQHNGQKKKDKQRSTKHTHTIKDRLPRTPIKTGVELWKGRQLLLH